MVEKVHVMKTNSATKIILCHFTGDNGHDKDSGKGKQGNENKLVGTLPNLTSVIHDFAR